MKRISQASLGLVLWLCRFILYLTRVCQKRGLISLSWCFVKDWPHLSSRSGSYSPHSWKVQVFIHHLLSHAWNFLPLCRLANDALFLFKPAIVSVVHRERSLDCFFFCGFIHQYVHFVVILNFGFLYIFVCFAGEFLWCWVFVCKEFSIGCAGGVLSYFMIVFEFWYCDC